MGIVEQDGGVGAGGTFQNSYQIESCLYYIS